MPYPETPAGLLFSQPPILENERVLLRPLERTDGEHLAHFAEEEPEIWTYSLVRIQSAEHMHQYIRDAVENRSLGKELPFVVYDKVSQHYAGSTRFYDIQLANASLQLGYTWYGREFQGTHVNQNCKFLLLDAAFDQLGMERVEFRADNRNERSKRAMLRLGCTHEGILRSHLPKPDGGRRDSAVFSILKSEWEGGLREKLAQRIGA
jgi:N-acetyltransferase